MQLPYPNSQDNTLDQSEPKLFEIAERLTLTKPKRVII